MSPPKDTKGEDPDDLTVEQIRSQLHDAAQGFQPSRAAMELRVAHGRAAPAEKRRNGARAYFTLRPVGAALAVVVISVLSVVAVRSGDDRPQVIAPAATAPVAASPSPSLPPSSPTGTRAGTSSGHPRLTSTAPPTGTPSSAGRGTTAGFLTAGGAVDAHSVDTWSQNNVTVTNTTAVDSLLITIKIPLSAGTDYAGKFTTVPNSDITMAVTRDATTMTYSYALRAGATLKPGSYVFAAQFLHHAGRDADGDAYTVVARAGGADTTLGGGFG